MPRGAVFVPFCYYEAAANMLTNPVLDPFGKIPEFKYCAVRVTKGGPAPDAFELRRRHAADGLFVLNLPIAAHADHAS